MAIQRPAEHNQDSLQDGVFTLSYESDPVLSDIQNAGVYLYVVALVQWKTGREGGREQTETEGQVEFRAKHFFARSLTLQESQIASGSRHPPLFLPFPPPCLPLSFLPFILSSLVFFFFFWWHSSSFLTLLFWLLWRSVLLGGMAQGDDVWREAVFEQDTSVSLAVQLSYEAIPVDHKAWTKPALQNTRDRPSLL